MDLLMNLPNDNVLDIIFFLDIKSYLQLRQTCKRFLNLDISRLIQEIEYKCRIEYIFLEVLHRDNDQPAIIWWDGEEEWYRYGQEHRDNDRPAVIRPNGTMHWYRYGCLHRDNDQPAVIWWDGEEEYYNNGEFIC